ncbi:hypothetical protein JOM56_014942 [Amanita muscaria]
MLFLSTFAIKVYNTVIRNVSVLSYLALFVFCIDYGIIRSQFSHAPGADVVTPTAIIMLLPVMLGSTVNKSTHLRSYR